MCECVCMCLCLETFLVIITGGRGGVIYWRLRGKGKDAPKHPTAQVTPQQAVMQCKLSTRTRP